MLFTTSTCQLHSHQKQNNARNHARAYSTSATYLSFSLERTWKPDDLDEPETDDRITLHHLRVLLIRIAEEDYREPKPRRRKHHYPYVISSIVLVLVLRWILFVYIFTRHFFPMNTFYPSYPFRGFTRYRYEQIRQRSAREIHVLHDHQNILLATSTSLLLTVLLTNITFTFNMTFLLRLVRNSTLNLWVKLKQKTFRIKFRLPRIQFVLTYQDMVKIDMHMIATVSLFGRM